MEILYSKLYDKYNTLKTGKETEMEQYNREQELKFMNYVSAAEDMIGHLKNENDKLHAQIRDLTDQMASSRSDKEYQYAEYQKLLIEENEKTKMLNEEVERLRNLLAEDFQSKSPFGSSQVRSSNLSMGSVGNKTLMPCTRHSRIQIEEAVVMVKETERGPSNGVPTNDSFGSIQPPDCIRRNRASSGDGENDTGHANFMFKNLLECIVGMKVCTVNQTEGCLSVLHQSSGYSFSLTWVTPNSENTHEEPELLYHVYSLGSFQRVAPPWMRQDLMFTMRMCPCFFERVSEIIKLQ
ncbi:uncharacterized protein LOC143857967 [Tasmannia lanceolata]|uniref:uncharacterized protein LOC143857967 n=1 Tax=Tasmannia lanceolata TaxID=3420 RepID=UPI00406397C4